MRIFIVTHSNLEGLVVDLSLHNGCLSQCAQLHRVPLGHVANNMRLRVLVAAIRTRVLRHDGSIEALGKLAAQAGDAALSLF